MELLHPVEVPKDADEGVGSVGVSTESHLRESNVVVDGDVARGDLGELGLSSESDVVHHLESDCSIQRRERRISDRVRASKGEGEIEERTGVISEEDVDSKETDDGEVSEVSVERLGSVLSGDLTGEEKVENEGRSAKKDARRRREEGTNAISSGEAPSRSAMSCSLILLFWMRE